MFSTCRPPRPLQIFRITPHPADVAILPWELPQALDFTVFGRVLPLSYTKPVWAMSKMFIIRMSA